MARALLVLALAAMMLVAASAGPAVAHSKKHRGKKNSGGSSARCASTFSGCRTCRTVAGEYTCVSCKLSNAVFDIIVPDKCVCNSEAGWGQFDRENWDLYRESEGLRPSRPPSACVKCEEFPGCGAGLEGECLYGGGPTPPTPPTETSGRRLFGTQA